MTAVLGLDFGEKRIGVAVKINAIISPVTTLTNDRLVYDRLIAICKEYAVCTIVIGRPLGVRMANLVTTFGKLVEKMVLLPVTYVEEVGTTREVPSTQKKHLRQKDMYSACLILERS